MLPSWSLQKQSVGISTFQERSDVLPTTVIALGGQSYFSDDPVPGCLYLLSLPLN